MGFFLGGVCISGESGVKWPLGVGGLDIVTIDDWCLDVVFLFGGVCGSGENGILPGNAVISSSHLLFTEPGGKLCSSSLSSIIF